MASKLNQLARQFRALHKPGQPVILTNVHDAVSAKTVVALPDCKAIASASWAIAAVQGIEDNDLTFEQNLVGIKNIIAGLREAGKLDTIPLSVDLQNGYDVKHAVSTVIGLGCIGANIEDVDHDGGRLRTIEEAVTVIETAVKAAADAGVPEFVVNARTDAYLFGHSTDEVEKRSLAYLKAGATTAFVWDGKKGVFNINEVKRLSAALNGRLAVQGPGVTSFTFEELRQAGVSRISYGPWLLRQSVKQYEELSSTLLQGQEVQSR